MERILSTDTPKHLEAEVTVNGWVHVVRKMGKIIFIEVRDRAGRVQVVFGPDQVEAYAAAKELKPEYVVSVTGTVAPRVGKNVRPDHPTGTVELQAHACTILARSETPPFEIVETTKQDVNEDVRFKYRYLDLRRQHNRERILKRSAATKFIRDFLHREGFVEIETPILAKSTPEGARDYLVPSRVYPGRFYALPQSPQQYKQMLMVAGFERYFQIAPCFRDEDSRGDRSPDQFYQVDMELSFTTQDEILDLTERLFTELIAAVFPEKTVTQSPWPRLTHAEAMEKYGTDKPDLRKNSEDPNELAFCFIVDWPLFEPEKENGHYAPAHHMFTAPKTGDIPLLDTDPLEAKSWQHDVALNGYEVGGGSIRITDPAIQSKIFDLVGISKADAQAQFGHMLEAFRFGVPPHGGIAPGLDRLLMILLNAPNVREVVAFPKTGDNREIMTGSPSAVSEEQIRTLHLSAEKPEDT
ncbi:MAG: aspartate--tRNA ligase [Candidatus Kerfeldbacteria bacterium]|nr:aspartate--tRNA ligase [Candidatus Kerfeldbacteria bacterium]